jgi:mannose-6-phosphate isomerase
LKDQILRLRGKVQHYAWGGYEYIPNLLGEPNIDHKPCAEYWLGAHPSASSDVELADGTTAFLHDLIEQLPFKYIGEDVYNKFGELPYLLKILDVREMLSIQVHPSKEEAIKGFEREEAAGIPINAPNRNYKDKNHKPEVMIALSEFWLLHGFKKEEALAQTLQSVPQFAFLQNTFKQEGYYGLYKHVMEMPQQQVDEILLPIVENALQMEVSKQAPEFWIKKLYQQKPTSNVDRGIFSIYFFNIVCIPKGQAIFQGAGVPHAYLEGQNVELMANSDNVLRGGLTPKHIDVPELLKHTRFEAVEPNILVGERAADAEANFPLPVEDFGISAVQLQPGERYTGASFSAEIFLLVEGSVEVAHHAFKKGEAFIVLPNTNYIIVASEHAVMYKAFVPRMEE